MSSSSTTVSPHRLPRIELALYAIVVVISYSYATYQLFKESQAFRQRTLNGHGLLQPGWEILGKRFQDVMPSEWDHWKYFTLHPTSIAVYVGHVTGGFVISRLFPEWRSSFLLMSSLVGAATIMGIPVFGLILLHALISYVTVVFGRRVWLLWAVVLVQLALTVIEPLSSWQRSVLPEERELHVKYVISGSFCCLRFIGFGVAYIKRQQQIEKQQHEDEKSEVEKSENEKCEKGRKEQPWTLWEYLLYVFYLPIIPHGPYTPPEGFLRQIKQAYSPSSQREVAWVCLQWLRPFFSLVVMEVLHHFIYVSAFSLLPYQLNSMPLIALVACVEWLVIIFQLQYMVYYGFGRAIAIFDGVLIPELPACMQSMYKAQDGWRYFDRGEHHFVLRNIYIACGGSQHGALRQQLALTISFSFTCYWHGAQSASLVFVLVVWTLLQCRILAKIFGLSRLTDNLSGVMQRRLNCLIGGIEYPIIMWSIVVFLSGVEVGKIVLLRLASQVWALPCLFLVHYCHLQLIKECEARWTRKYLIEKMYMAPPHA